MSDAFVALLRIELHFPEAHSLKAKRSELQSVKAHLHQRLGATVLIVTHDVGVAESCARTVTLRDARIAGDVRR